MWAGAQLLTSCGTTFLSFSLEACTCCRIVLHTFTVSACMCVCVCCLPPALCITPGINQSSLLVICRLHFPACRGAKCLCKPLWEINTINTARFNSPQAHNIFKYLSTVLPPSSPISLSCLCSFCCFSLLFRCATIPLFDIFLLHQTSLCVLPLPCAFLFLQQLIDIFSPPHQSSDWGHNNPSLAGWSLKKLYYTIYPQQGLFQLFLEKVFSLTSLSVWENSKAKVHLLIMKSAAFHVETTIKL